MDLEQIESLLKLMQEYQVASLEVESEGSRVKLDMVSSSVPMAYAAPAAVPSASPAASTGTWLARAPQVLTHPRPRPQQQPWTPRWSEGGESPHSHIAAAPSG